MRPALLLILSFAVLGSAHAQSRSPAVGSIALPLSLHATVEHIGQHSCSQSYATSHSNGTMELAIDRAGVAHLTLDGIATQRMGPSPGRYLAGDHTITDTRHAHHAVWSGTATLVGQSLTIAFDRVAASELYYVTPTPPALPAVTATPTSLGMQCTIATPDVFPAIGRPGEVGVATPLLSCQWTGSAPAPAMFYVTGNTVFGAGPGIALMSNESDLAIGPTQQIRFVP